jgi:pyruvate,water dikinase
MSIQLLTTLGTDASPAQLGGKAAALGRLLAWGLPVPDGFVLTTAAYDEHAARTGLLAELTPALQRRAWPEVEQAAARLLTTTPLDPALETQLADAWREMGSPAVAVRSSATAEDMDGASFAGQYESFLGIADFPSLVDAVKRCWASLWNQRSLHYRSEHGLPPEATKMAVIVQRLVPADAAGVLFTVDPLSQDRGRMLLEVVPGLGEALVSGRTRGECCTLDRASRKLRPIGAPPRLLPLAQLRELGRLALEVESRAGCPQDIEFAVAAGQVSLLQARPITTLGEPVPPLPPPSVMDRRMLSLTFERYAIAPRPLDTAVFVQMVGAAAYAGEQFGLVIAPEAYAEFRRTLWHQQYRLPRYRMTLRALLHPITSLRLLREDWMTWWLAEPRKTIERIAAPVGLGRLGDAELLDRAGAILAAWEEPTNRRFYATCAVDAEKWLQLLVSLAVGRRAAPRVTGQLLSGIATPTGEANTALWDLSRLARRDPATLDAIRRDDWAGVPPDSDFARALRAFFAQFGHRESGGFYLSSPTWRHDPTPVRQILRTLAETEERHEASASAHVEAQALVEQRLHRFPWLRRRFVALLEQIRTLHRFREVSHFDLTRPLDALQTIAAELGRRLRSRGLATADDDVFYLTFGEVRQWLVASPPGGTNPREFIARRRATYRLVNARWQAARPRPKGGGTVLHGTAASPGRVRGVARVVLDEGEFDRLRPGEILVCPHSNPSWTPLFLTASAVVSDTGGAASHAAIVAREYGLPAVLTVPGATQLIRDGQTIEVDGDRGVVSLLATETPETPAPPPSADSAPNPSRDASACP